MEDMNNATLTAYIECAIWSSTDDGGDPLGDSYTASDLSAEAFESMRADIEDFEALLDREGIDRSDWTDEQLGHDFWLTRNRHGAGFWDRGHGDVGETLTRYAHAYGESDLYVGDDGRLYVTP